MAKAALEARGHSIRVNAISPGFLLTKMVSSWVLEGDRPLAGSWSGFEARQGRPATFNEIGDVAVLITSPRMSLVNGVNLPVDGYV
jgi:NAD(P)-dependent dehydrogenase (short-subunit alcohol dehydrogenase family)